MSTVTCPVCSFTYAISNITNHIQKAHAGFQVSQQDAEVCGLVACSCSQVILNAAVLKKHQGVCHCETSALPTPPAMLQPDALQPEISAELPPTPEDTQPEGQEDVPFFLQEATSLLPSPPQSPEITHPLSPISNPDGATLPELPEPSHNEWDIDEEDIPEDGIIVLLPPIDEPQMQPPDLLLNMAEDSSTWLPSIPPLMPIQDWDFDTATDVDFFSVTISPAALLHIYPPGCFLALVAHAPETCDLPHYKDWVFFAELKCQLCFEPQHKLLLLEHLCQAPQSVTLLASPYPAALTWGQQLMVIAPKTRKGYKGGCQPKSPFSMCH